MIKGIYIVNYDLDNRSSGVCKKVKEQIRILEANNIMVDVIDAKCVNINKHSKLYYFINEVKGFSSLGMIKLLEKAEEMIKRNCYSFIYIRKGFLDINQIKILNRIKLRNNNIPIFMEIPTYPYFDEFGLSHHFALRNEKKAVKQLDGCINYIVTYSIDKTIYGVPTIILSNGVSYDSIKMVSRVEHTGINMIAVALFAKWHGYDRLIRGMHDEIDLVKENKVKLYLIGSGPEIKRYKKLTHKYRLSEYVYFTGPLYGDKLSYYYNLADIGVDCLARHRVGVSYNSTLKGKEYCAKGLPIISGVTTELDFIDSFDYYLRFPADESPISISTIISFFNNKNLRSKNTSYYIRNSTYSKFDMKYAFDPVVKKINDCLK